MQSPSKRKASQQFGDTIVDNNSVSLQGIFDNLQLNLNNSNLRVNPFDYLDSLPEAAFNAKSRQHASTCLPGTRSDILAQIYQWADGSGERRLYWLNGMAGTGKSTIATSVAREYYNQGRLGASFFFSRGSGDRATAERFAMTVATQLAAIPELRQRIYDGVASSNNIRHFGLYDQWEKLILKPLSQITHNPSPFPILIVVDALDECDNQDDIPLLIRCLKDATTVPGTKLRCFITSRPDRPVKLGFEGITEEAHENFMLHNIEQATIDDDLALYYKHKLANIAQELNIRDSIYLDNAVKLLVQRSHGLFIHAATVCRFVCAGKQFAGERLSLLIKDKYSPSKPEKELDQIYMTVLESSFTGAFDTYESRRLRDLFKRIVGSIILLFDVISTVDLAEMHSMPIEGVRSALADLCSVLDVPKQDDMPVRLLHPSFRDFLLDSTRCLDDKLSIDAPTIHGHLLDCCLQVMTSYLRRPDICNFQKPGIHIRNISKSGLVKNIPYLVQYSCRYWIRHLQHSHIDPTDHPGIKTFFRHHLLFWLETLALVSRLSDAVVMIQTLDHMLSTYNSTKRRSFLSRIKYKFKAKPVENAAVSLHLIVHDALRFLLSYSSIIEEAPLQLYCSAIRFSPATSIIRKLYSDYIPKWITPTPTISEFWSPYLQVLQGHSSAILSTAIFSLVFSPDGKLMASASSDQMVRLWDATTGAELRVLKGHSSWVYSVAFSPDGKLVASASSDQMVRLWDAATGTGLRVLKGHSDVVFSVAFSPDGKLVASASYDQTVRFWNTTTGAELRVLKGHSNWVYSVTFSPNGRLVATASYDQTVRLWDATTGAERRVSKGHADAVLSVVFSPDSKLVASASTDQTVRLWDATTSAERHVLKGHSGWVLSVVFSPNGKIVASASSDQTVRLWDATTGAELRVLKGHSSWVLSVVFSPDAKLIASASSDQTVRLWDAATGAERRVFKGRSDAVLSVAFSPDGRPVTSASSDQTIQLSEVSTGAKRRIPADRSDILLSMVFSTNGKLVASASSDQTIRLWDATTGDCLKTFRLRSVSEHLSFDCEDQWLLTDAGPLSIKGFLSIRYRSHRASIQSSTNFGCGNSFDYSLSEDGAWITHQGNNLLWLPTDARQCRPVISGSTVAVGCNSAKVVFVRLSYGESGQLFRS